jgi:hypothetical protein
MIDRKGEGAPDPEYVGYCHPPKSGQFVKGRSGNLRGRPRRPKTAAAGIPGGSEFDAMFVEEMKRQVTVREGDNIEKTSLERAATRAIGLKAAKGDVKAYKAVIDKRTAIDKRKQAEWEELLRMVLDYKREATEELMRRKMARVTGPDIIPHPDDIEIDPQRRIISNGPMTLEQKMAQDLMVTTWPQLDRKLATSRLFVMKDPKYLRQYHRMKKQMDIVYDLVAKRACKTNSWEEATLEERKEYLRKHSWPEVSKGLPRELARSEYCFLATFRLWLNVEPTKEQERAFLIEARKAFAA